MKTKIEISTLSLFLLVVAHIVNCPGGGGTDCYGTPAICTLCTVIGQWRLRKTIKLVVRVM